MSRGYDREEAVRIAAEKMRRKKEQEEKEEKEIYERITSGWRWMLFKGVVVFCTAMAIITTIDIFVDGPEEKLDKTEWRVDRSLYMMFHQSVKVDEYLFIPHFRDWTEVDSSSFSLTRSPILRTGKRLNYNLIEDGQVRAHSETRVRSIFDWFPIVQILAIFPLFVFLFRRQKPWFNFARIACLIAVFPAVLMIVYFTIF